jgi:hypothetical protein
VHEGNDVLRTGGRDAKQHVRAQHIEQEGEIEEAGKVKHCREIEVII